MEKIILFRLQDDNSVWLADLDAGTVERTNSTLATPTTEPFRGVDFALAARTRPVAPGHLMYPST